MASVKTKELKLPPPPPLSLYSVSMHYAGFIVVVVVAIGVVFPLSFCFHVLISIPDNPIINTL